MAATIDGGTGNQRWISRSAKDRAFATFSGNITFIMGAIVLFVLGLLAYTISIPRQIPVFVRVNADGSYAVYQNAASPEESGRKTMLVNWIGAWRVGATDPKSVAARQTSAMILSGTDPFTVVRNFNEDVADKHVQVTPVVRNVSGAGTDYVVDWDETVIAPHDNRYQRAMRAYVTIGFSPDLISLGVDPLLNPYGEYIAALRTVEIR